MLDFSGKIPKKLRETEIHSVSSSTAPVAPISQKSSAPPSCTFCLRKGYTERNCYRRKRTTSKTPMHHPLGTLMALRLQAIVPMPHSQTILYPQALLLHLQLLPPPNGVLFMAPATTRLTIALQSVSSSVMTVMIHPGSTSLRGKLRAGSKKHQTK